MGFWNDFADGLKDVGTSSLRIVTDTAIDIGDVATGFQFSDDMKKAKTTMSNAGILSAADAIEKNHYPFLEDWAEEAEDIVADIQDLFAKGQAQERERAKLMAVLADLCADIVLLSDTSLEAKALFEEARKIKHWEKWSEALDISRTNIRKVNATSRTVSKWETVGSRLVTTNLVVGAGSGMAALVAIGMASKGKSLAKLASGGKVAARAGLAAGTKGGKVAIKAAKFLKIGKVAGRASGVLAVITVGIDIGLSVVELEKKKSALSEQLASLRPELTRVRGEYEAVKRENAAIQARINELLSAVSPPQSLASWDSWVQQTKMDLQNTIRALVSLSGIEAMAREKALETRGKPFKARVLYVAAVDPEITEEEAEDIIKAIDLEDGLVATDFAAFGGVSQVSALTWAVTGPEKAAVSAVAGLDAVKMDYFSTEPPQKKGWTYYATAPWTRALKIDWRYGAAHTPADFPSKVFLFVDTKQGGRVFHTLHAGAPQTVADPASGTLTLMVEEGCLFGAVIAPLSKSRSPAQEYCGTYICHPVENDWHVGTIDFKGEKDHVLQWTNRAGVQWDLLPNPGADQLLKTPGSPYQDQYPGGNSFDIQRKRGKIIGFDFLKARYTLDPSSLKPPRRTQTGVNLGMLWLEFNDE